jgi:tellurite resistance protein TehA-like permease
MTESRIRTLHPAWGALAMSLAGAAMVSLLDPLPSSRLDNAIGLVFLALAVITAITITVLYGIKLFAHTDSFIADVRHPGMGSQTAAWPASLLITALATSQAAISGAISAELALWPAIVFGGLGLAGTALVGFVFFSRVIGLEQIPPAAISASWFVPVVPLVLVPSISVRLQRLESPLPDAFVTWLGVSAWGIGFGLFLLLSAIIGGRLLLAEPLPPHALPSWWAWLAPLGAGGLGMVSSATLIGDASAIALAEWMILAVWGFSAWWAVFALLVIIRSRHSAHFHLGYWAFGFPTAAFASLSLEVARRHEFAALSGFGAVVWGALGVLLVWLTMKTLAGVRSGAVFSR